VGEIHVHEFMTLDGVIDAPAWTSLENCQSYANGVVYLNYRPQA
jgi:hypothetical protein